MRGLTWLGFSNIYARVSDGDGNRFTLTVNRVRFEGEIEGNTISPAGTFGGAPVARLQRTISRVAGPFAPGATAMNLQGTWKTRWTGTIG
jgi:hypothetical protein